MQHEKNVREVQNPSAKDEEEEYTAPGLLNVAKIAKDFEKVYSGI